MQKKHFVADTLLGLVLFSVYTEFAVLHFAFYTYPFFSNATSCWLCGMGSVLGMYACR